MAVTFPMPVATLTRVHTLNSKDTAVEDFEAFLKQHVALIILNTFENSGILLQGANKLCLDEDAHPRQRVLWINQLDQLMALKSKIEIAVQAAFPEKGITFENIRAVSMCPDVVYVIFIDPSLSPDPKDKRKKLSVFQMKRAFNAAVKALPPIIEVDVENPTPSDGGESSTSNSNDGQPNS